VEWLGGDQVMLDRRGLLKAACATCAALGVASCGGGSSPSTANGGGPASTQASGAASPSAAGTSGVIVKLAAIPVGGSVSGRGPNGEKLLLAQPTAGTVVAFSAICTHQGCTVEPDGKKLACPCHGSVYDAFTGKNISGPAPSPLHPFAVKVSGTDVVAA
jgi:cytochrome b6-f complex iron-sulfur subunit